MRAGQLSTNGAPSLALIAVLFKQGNPRLSGTHNIAQIVLKFAIPLPLFPKCCEVRGQCYHTLPINVQHYRQGNRGS